MKSYIVMGLGQFGQPLARQLCTLGAEVLDMDVRSDLVQRESARSLNSHNVLDYIELSEDYGILEVSAPKSWAGKTLKELNVRAKLGVNIIAVESQKKTNASPFCGLSDSGRGHSGSPVRQLFS